LRGKPSGAAGGAVQKSGAPDPPPGSGAPFVVPMPTLSAADCRRPAAPPCRRCAAAGRSVGDRCARRAFSESGTCPRSGAPGGRAAPIDRPPA
jgi:hypothetical protein